MKSIILLAFSFVFTPYFAKNLVIEPTKPFTSISIEITGELVIGVPNFNMKRYDNFVKDVVSVPGIRNIEYCSKNSVFLINYDHSVYPNAETAFRAIENQVKGYQLFLKKGASHTELKTDC